MQVFAEAAGIDEAGVIFTMAWVTAAVLLVVGVSIYLFARWSMKERRRREREINTSVELKP